ncbi:MAG: orotidine-5'-phosphate decarboxylase [Acidobacteriota bacterium]|nr:orotidine-5'-phosphate decarboxylase [Acidobacteriota bacterium]
MNKNPIIIALDVETAREASETIGELRQSGCAFKIGLQLFCAVGASFVRETVDSGVRIFLDLKFHDIPNTVAKASIEAARMRVWMFNVHASGGGEMMKTTAEQVREVCDKENLIVPHIIAVTVLTSSNQETLRETGIESSVETQVVKLAELTAKCGLGGVVASPLEVRLIRENVEAENFLIVTPGVRPNFATNDDQKRVTTAGEAVAGGSDYLVIGRPILNAPDKNSAMRKILEEIAFYKKDF